VKRKKMVVAILLVLGAVAALPLVKFYFIKADGGRGYILWKNDEAYLFMYDRPFGYYLSGAQWLVEPLAEYFHGSAAPIDDANILAIFHITASSVERHTQKSTIAIDSFTPLDDTIYSICPGGICKWTGAQFELISSEEEQKIDGRKQLVNNWTEFHDVNGWSRRTILPIGPGEAPVHGEFSIEVNKQISILVTQGNPTSVDLQRPGQPSERIWYYKRGTSMVSETKYKSVFGLH
jgi:hypothetical protein